MAVARKERRQHEREVKVANEFRFTLDRDVKTSTTTIAHWQAGRLLRCIILPDAVLHQLLPVAVAEVVAAPVEPTPVGDKPAKPRAARAKRNPIDDK